MVRQAHHERLSRKVYSINNTIFLTYLLCIFVIFGVWMIAEIRSIIKLKKALEKDQDKIEKWFRDLFNR
ncbi:Uncharacterised protein [Moraxella lacunata]|uniref:Uncharacterized protein n=1 Tax=Moraxella lacunata TaxID=477 RepID=A0A378T5H7_MORLA|nr:hypothetical protein [Moraxella lacunata]STZ55654.1 Uncharacterised protein [Moraxella lacunata]STZ55667.1 Uncharacterised protein [Moraxella lacunata]